MKSKLLLFSLLSILVTTFAACGDDDDDRYDTVRVPQEYTEAMKAKYPEAVNVKWEKKPKYYVGEFSKPQQEYDVWFGAGAEWAMTEIEYGRNLFFIPGVVTSALANSEYGTGYTVEDVSEYQRVADTFYVIEVEPEQGGAETYLYYKPDGTMVKAIKIDVDIMPDTAI